MVQDQLACFSDGLRVVAALFTVEPHPIERKVSAVLRGHDMEEPYHHRGHATVAASVGGGQLRGEAAWGRRTRRSGAGGTDGANAA